MDEPTNNGWNVILNNWAGVCLALTVITTFVASVYHYVFVPIRSHFLSFNVQAFNGLLNDVKAIKNEVLPENQPSVTQRIQQVQHSNEQLQAIFRAKTEMDSIAMFITDEKGEAIVVSDGYTRITGLTTTEAQHGGWLRSIHPQDVEDVQETWEHAVANGRTFVDDYRYVNVLTNVVKQVHVEIRPVRLNSGKIVGFSGKVIPVDSPTVTI